MLKVKIKILKHCSGVFFSNFEHIKHDIKTQ